MNVLQNTVIARAPLRLGIAGGGSDVPSYSDLYGGYVLNATIQKYAYATLKLERSRLVRFEASDLNQSTEMQASQYLDLDDVLPLHKAVYNRMVKDYNGGSPIGLRLITSCDAPMGSGLGSSSTLVVAMLAAFRKAMSLELSDYELAKLAYEIERIDCGFSGGKQDQYAASFGGFNFMEFRPDGSTLINPLRVKNDIISHLEMHSLLFSSGISRVSSKIIDDQVQAAKTNESKTLEAMHGIKNEAFVMKQHLLMGNFPGMVDSLQLGWRNKKLSSSSVSSPHLDKLIDAAYNAGAKAAKVSGAGGGGFIWFYVEPQFRVRIQEALTNFGGTVNDCKFTFDGAEAWVA